MESTTTTTTVNIATAANYEANAVVEELLKRDQGMFDSAEILAALDLVDTAVSLATDADPAKLDLPRRGRRLRPGEGLQPAPPRRRRHQGRPAPRPLGRARRSPVIL